MLTTAPSPRTPAAIARAMSSGLPFLTATGARRAAGAAGAGRGAEEAGADLATAAAGGLPAAGGFGGEGAAEGADLAGAAAGLGAADLGAAAGTDGSLIVAEEVGLGGKLMRTVSFLGCTLGASAGLGGTGALGGLEFSSAIKQE